MRPKSGTILPVKPFLRPAFLLILAAFLLADCRPQTRAVVILDGGQVFSLSSTGRTPAEWLAEAGRRLGPDDRLLALGRAVDPAAPLPDAPLQTLQIRRALSLTLVSPQGTRPIQTAAFTVGQALAEAGVELYAGDRLDPPAETPLNGPLTVTYTPARLLTVQAGGQSLQTRSAAATVGQALAEAGLALEGLDESIPAESEPLPGDGQIQVVRVHEALLLSQKAIPFEIEYQAAGDLPLDQQEILQPGEPGLSLSRVRIRYADGQEVARQTEDETVVRPPKPQIVRTGTKVVVETISVDGQKLEVWRTLDMYATWYSPCHSGTTGCAYGTASGLRAGRGVVAVDPGLYAYLQGQRIYVPGYGFAVIGDIGGGYIIESSLGVSRYRWIDLGFDDNNIVEMSGWVKVYFLAPAPGTLPPVLQ